MLKIIVIARTLGVLERNLLEKNCYHARRVFGKIAVAYVLGERNAFDAAPISDPAVSVYLVSNPKLERNAALSRGVGYEALKVTDKDLVLFLDGDMLVTEGYLRFLRNLNHVEFLALSGRVDIRCADGRIQRRRLHFSTDTDGRFIRLYGSIALRGIAFERYNIMTHDMEEQWFLRVLGSHPALHELYSQIGILHFDRFVGIDRKMRFATSSRGIGIWQGLLRDASIGRIISDIHFFLHQKQTVGELVKFLVASTIALPKLFLFTMPQRLSYQEITDDRT